ncbi:MAG: anti-sigma regulatory factor [Alphaproteobacteria bacterium]|nr:anti-sigma regulatory factor [Alphaproteobacteria bacterium]
MQRIEIRDEQDIVRARTAARSLAETLNFSVVDKTRIATAVSELARNVVVHGGGGYVEVESVNAEKRVGMRCVFVDQGPGIEDVERAMAEGFSTAGTIGHGLPGARRLMDDLSIEATPGQGTRVEIIKWIP